MLAGLNNTGRTQILTAMCSIRLHPTLTPAGFARRPLTIFTGACFMDGFTLTG